VRLVFALMVLAAACVPTPTHHCASNDDCGGGGTCVAVGDGDMRCSIGADSCDSSLRWSDDAGDLAGTCVAGSAPLDWDPCVEGIASNHNDSCSGTVCAEDERCCTREWSDQCVQLADRLCSLGCGDAAAFVGIGETWVGFWDGSQYVERWSDDVTGHDIDGVAWGDYDNDGKPDLVTCEDGTLPDSAIRVYHNDGFSFSLVKASVSGLLCWDIDFVDMDGDGDLDVVANGAYEGEWMRNDNGLWDEQTTAVEQAYLTEMDWADVDGDGKMDAAVARYELSMHVDQNNGTPTFTTIYDSGDGTANPPPRYQSVTWGDVDEVGGLDLAVAGEGFLRVIPNTDPNGFAAGARTLDPPSGDVDQVRFIDADEDGDLDVLAVANDAPMRLYRNDDNGGVGTGFTGTPMWESGTTVPFSAPIEDARVAIGDINGDQHEDILICGQGDYCQAWLSNADGTFTKDWDPPDQRHIEDVALTNDWRK